VNIAGSSWKLYKGPNGDTTVFSFVADSQVNNFSGNVKHFLKYLVLHQGLPNSQYLTSVGAGELLKFKILNPCADCRTPAGTEPFTGSKADFVVSGYAIAIK
jgi:xyloglucan-specific endo-beta-1,4-glucanase